MFRGTNIHVTYKNGMCKDAGDYKVAVIYDGVILGVGEGTNKKIAQQEAAGDALTRKVN